MTPATATASTVSTSVSASPEVQGLPPAEERGTLTVSDRVVERVAGYAVVLVDGAAAAPRRVLGVKVGDADVDDEAHVRARVAGRTATIEASIAVRWPAPVHAVAAEARRRIREDVARITDVVVDHVDLDVVSLAVPAASRARVR
jgi:uncharacterized alkaline shock family protein YloU